jgi:hypothetical protein
VNEFQLHVFELTYLLSLMRVESVAALPNTVLFPPDAKIRRKVMQDGEKRLIEAGHITPGAVAGTATYNEALLSLVAAIADPQLTILTRRQGDAAERADATIFMTNVEAVEVTQTERHAFRLRQLKDGFDAFQHVRKMVGVTPSPVPPPGATELRIRIFEQVRAAIADNDATQAEQLLADEGVEPVWAHHLVLALAKPQRKGVVSILKHAGQKVTDVRVMGFYQAPTATWLTSVVAQSADLVRIEVVDTELFVSRLVERVASLAR